MAFASSRNRNSITDDRFSRLTGKVYETVEAPERWPEVFADLAGALNAKSGLIRTLDLRGDRAVLSSHHHNLDDRLQAEYCGGLVRDDPYLDALERRPAGRMVINDQLIDLERFRKSEFYRHYMEPLDNHYLVGGFVDRDADGRYTIIGLHRHRRGIQFNSSELGLVQRLAPHVKRAIHLRRILGQRQQRAESAERALDALGMATCLLDGHGRLLHANQQGEYLLRCGQGLCLRDGRITTANPGQSPAFEALLEHGRRAGSGRLPPAADSLLLRQSGVDAPNLLAIVMPIAQRHAPLYEAWPEARLVLYAGDLDDTGLLRPDILCAIYGLTRTEARLAVALGRGRDLPQLADDWGVAPATLRTQLKAVFAKTGAGRQAELVRLLAGAPWKLAGGAGEEGRPA